MSSINSDVTDHQHRLNQALTKSLALYGETVEESFPIPVQYELADTPSFLAEVELHADGYVISISRGCIAEIARLWENSWQSPIFSDANGERLPELGSTTTFPEWLADASLTWLILHELMHIHLGHLELIETGQLVETDVSDEENSGKKAAAPMFCPPDIRKALKSALTPREQSKLRPCLELQADNDATEIMLGGFDEEHWQRMRISAVSIFVVMALIEKFNTKSDKASPTHPSAATRFFSLMGQLFQYWLYPGAELYSDGAASRVKTAREARGEEFNRYLSAVLIPLVNDVVFVATWAEARTFLIDLGDESAIFRDILDAQYSESLDPMNFKTNAAKEWCDLLPINEKILRAMGHRE